MNLQYILYTTTFENYSRFIKIHVCLKNADNFTPNVDNRKYKYVRQITYVFIESCL